MKMKIKINEEKVKIFSKLTVDEIYQKIDNLSKNVGIIKKDNNGFYFGNDDKYDFSSFGIIITKLKNCDWFKDYVEEWLLYVDEGVDDVAKFYREKGQIA